MIIYHPISRRIHSYEQSEPRILLVLKPNAPLCAICWQTPWSTLASPPRPPLALPKTLTPPAPPAPPVAVPVWVEVWLAVLVVSNCAKAGMAAPAVTRANAAITLVVRAMFLVIAEVHQSVLVYLSLRCFCFGFQPLSYNIVLCWASTTELHARRY